MKMRQFHSAVIFLFIFIASPVHCQNSVYRLSTDVTPTIYDLSLRVDTYVFSGNVTIDVRVSRAVTQIELHQIGLTINGRIVVTSPDNVTEALHWYNNDTQKMTILLGRTLRANTDHKISISFNGRIDSDMKGLYQSTYYNGTVKYIQTTFSAAAYARKIFPCFDEPAFKAKFRLKIACPSNYSAVANTKISNIDYEQDFFILWKITEFEETPLMSTYLLAFTVSDFRNITNSDELEFSVYASVKEYNNMKFALNAGRDLLKALEDFTGQPYTLNKMDFIAIDDFLYGAMENWGLVSYKTSRIVNPEGMRNRKKVQDIISIISHELVHQWFGNLVTCQYWDFVWLNEGFASYLEYVIAEKIFPDWRILDQFSIEDMHPVMLNDVKPKTHAMTRPVNTPEEITKIYDFVAYPKAASVIRMIEHIMTPPVFQKALQNYLDERKFSTATDEQLYTVLNRTSSDFNGTYPPIPIIFRTWANNPGFPILNVNYLRSEKLARITQEQFMPLINETESSQFYILYNYVSSQRASAEHWLTEKAKWHWIYNEHLKEHAIDGNPEWLIFNIQQTGYYRVNYDTDNWNAIINTLESNNFHIIHMQNRAQLLDDSFNLAKSGYLDFNVALKLLKYVRSEFELPPIAAGLKIMEFLYTYFDAEPFYRNLLDFIHETVDEIYIRINNSSHPEYPRVFPDNYHQVLRLRLNLFACRIGSSACTSEARSQMFMYDLQIRQPHADERPHFYCGALHGDLASTHWMGMKMRLQDITRNEELYRDNQEEISEILFAFSNCDNDVARTERLMVDIFNKTQSTSYDLISREDASSVVISLIRASSKHREMVLDFYMNRYSIINSTVPLSSVLSAFATTINSVPHLEKLKEVGIEIDVDIDGALDEIEGNLYWMSKKAPEIAVWVENERGFASKLKFSITMFISSLIFVMAVK